MRATHEVLNQPPPLAGHDPIAGDAALAEACLRHADRAALDSLAPLGRLAGSAEAQEWGRLANDNPPRLRTHDRYGHRVDEVEFHPAWHELMRVALGHGLAGTPWRSEEPHAHVRRAVGYLGWTQVEMGHGCPVTMTYAVVPALRAAPALAARYEPGVTSTQYALGLTDPAVKPGLVAGMGMTERQGGSDVRAGTTRAVEQADGSYRLTGHKWFTSAPMSDLFLVLAQLEESVTCFLVPRVLPGGSRSPFRLQRLKDKLGDRSNASSEVEFEDTVGWRVGADSRYDAALARLRAELADPQDLAFRARRLTAHIALCLQGSLLLRHAVPSVADTFCATRLGGDWSPVLGSLPPGSPVSALVGRATVGLDG